MAWMLLTPLRGWQANGQVGLSPAAESDAGEGKEGRSGSWGRYKTQADY